MVLAILAGLIYEWASVRRVGDDLHDMQRTPENEQKPGYRKTWWVTHFPNFNLSVPCGLMTFFFFCGVVLFAVFAVTVLTKGGHGLI